MANKIIDSLTYGSDNYTFSIPYGTCSTRENIANKVVTCPNFTVLEAGARVAVKFTYPNDIEAPTLNVNNTGAKIIYNGSVSNCGSWPADAIVDFIFDGTYWCFVSDGGLYAGLEQGDVIASSADLADHALSLWTGKTNADSVPIPLNFNFIGAIATQNSCFALGAKVANTASAFPPFLVSKTSSTSSINAYADTLLEEAPGLDWTTEWYSGDWDGADYATGEYVMTNYSPFPITVYFYLTASFGDGSNFQNSSSSRIVKTLKPGDTISGHAAVDNPWGNSGEVASSYPGLTIEAIGYDTAHSY